MDYPVAREVELRKNLLDDTTMHIGEPEVAPCVAESEAFVIEAETPQDGCLDVVNVNRLVHDMETEIVRGAIGEAGFDAAAGHPHGEGLRMMVAAERAAK